VAANVYEGIIISSPGTIPFTNRDSSRAAVQEFKAIACRAPT
jgi:hypothetical protein